MTMNRDRYRKLLLSVSILSLVGLALVVVAIKYTSGSAFCVNCHEMKPIYEAWQSSKHSSVECMKCHSDPGIVGLVETKVKALSEVYRHFTKTYRQPITIDADTAAFSNRCLRCHDIKGKSPEHNLTHFSSDVNCADCHQGLVHNPATNRKLPTSDICEKCHG